VRFQQIKARDNWRQIANSLGYMSSIFDDPPYWVEALDEPFCAVFDQTEVSRLIEPATNEIIELALETVDYVCNSDYSDQLFDRLKIPIRCRNAIRTSWRYQEPSIWGRLDFSYSGDELKLLELNFGGAISLYEAALFQMLWLQGIQHSGEVSANALQSNTIHESLIKAFADLIPDNHTVHFVTPSSDPEESDTVRYLQSCAVTAKRVTKFLQLKDVGIDKKGRLVDLESQEIKYLVKLYPWELLFREDAKVSEKTGRSVLLPLIENRKTFFFEPIWKSILTNKGVLNIMQELKPDCKWLLESAIDGTPLAEKIKTAPHVKKPLIGAQGSGVSIVYPDQPEKSTRTPGGYEKAGFLIQKLHPLPKYNDYHLVLGSWVIAGRPAGIGVRADLSPITTGKNCIFVPHYVEPLN
jgi:glutathionylspermidine synthase